MNQAIAHRLRFAGPALGIGLLVVAATTHAQVYRSVGPDGQVTFSDTPPAAQGAQAPKATSSRGAAPSGNAALPYELRQSAQRYPVTLYTTTACDACTSGRQLLTARGVPFTEKTVSSNADIAALQKLTGADSLPALTIGAQKLKGFSDAQWSQYLDAAGYPKQSQLPATWRSPAPTALTSDRPAPSAASASAPNAAASAPPEPSVNPPLSPTNPNGIRF